VTLVRAQQPQRCRPELKIGLAIFDMNVLDSAEFAETEDELFKA
jgi:hypothetical protein